MQSSNHPQRGIIGIYIGVPRGRAGYLIWEPRSKTVHISADVTFDETFSSIGPFRHKAFKDALPVMLPDAVPNIENFASSDPEDDHFGTPYMEYDEDVPTDGFLHNNNIPVADELFDFLPPPYPPVMEEFPPVEEDDDGDRSDNGAPAIDIDLETVYEYSDDEDDGEVDPTEPVTDPLPVQADPPIPTTARPLVDDDEVPPDHNTIIRPRKRTIRRRRIYDPSDAAFFVDMMLDCNDIPIKYVSGSIASALSASVDFAKSVEGMDPAAFLPEPQSLNMISKDTFQHPTDYNGERCLPIRTIHKTKLRSDGMVEKLKVRMAIRGDMDKDAGNEDNSAPLATFRVLKCFLADAARRRRRVYQADFVGAYLQALMDRIVYVMLPIELAEYFPDLAEWFGVPLLLYKSAYGMNSAGHLWAEELFGWYSDYGFLQSSVEPALFTYKNGDDWIILLSYCDNTAYYTSSDTVRQQFETALCSRFECKLLGQLHWFLQARITQSDNFNITLDQSRYAASIS
jgi:Reverse transcriptase (RNA-dependent DNA polymerase)